MRVIDKEVLPIITIAADSLSMVRPDMGVAFLSTYPYLLQAKLKDKFFVIVRNRRANNSEVQSNELNLQDDILCNRSKYVALHFGIVDCAPRLITRIERFCLRFFLWKDLGERYIQFKSKYRRFFTKYFQWTLVPIHKFEKNYRNIIQGIRNNNSAKKVVVVNIADTNDEHEYRSFGFRRNIKQYNSVLNNIVNENKDLCELVDIYKATKDNQGLLHSDGIHLSFEGHRYVSSEFVAIIKKFEGIF